MYCAVIGDIINSKKIEKREEVQKKLKLALLKINDEYKKQLASYFTVTLGDEFQGLLNNPKSVFLIISIIKKELHPIEIRFGIGFGSIYTEIDKEVSMGADGPAYHNARHAIENIKINNKKYENEKKNIFVKWSEKSGVRKSEIIELENLMNANLSACAFIETKWTKKQREVISKIMNSELSQRDIATIFKIKQSNVHRRLSTSGYYTYEKCMETVQNTIIDLWESANVK